MAIISDNKPLGPVKEYPIASEGVTPIVLADVEDLGIQDSELYGPKPQVRLTWVVDEKDPDGNYFVIARKFTNSLHEKSNLYPIVMDMLGKRPPVPFDLELLIGTASMGVIKRKKGTKEKDKDRTYANIVSFLSMKPGQTFAVPKDFVRGKDGGKYGKLPQERTTNNQNQSRTPAPAQAATRQEQTQLPPQQEVADEDIPF
jgi:hypothetical protein